MQRNVSWTHREELNTHTASVTMATISESADKTI